MARFEKAGSTLSWEIIIGRAPSLNQILLMQPEDAMKLWICINLNLKQ
jgi:hypothetical protein